ncbi:hypothetical protein OH809_25290 [Streptomyces sp. NBC_00873]|uniref:hypothetical protein n=1 Tax=Streptomyces sp. NBC_00873 TaxID=2975852 RepID=UPI00386E9A0C|nr:hypothetical protein OH809_25290 [Streptomyces sp. NBC_00873]
MYHYRDAKAGKFYLERHELHPGSPSETPPFLRFARKHGPSLDLWSGEGHLAAPMLESAGLHWPVEEREVLVPIKRRGERKATPVRGYKALVRPDTEQVMSVVTTSYSVAENEWVALALQQFCSRLGEQKPIIAATSFGRDAERTMFAGRVSGNEEEALCVIAYNTHGGEGAVCFQLVEVHKRQRTTFILDSAHASLSIAHVGRMQYRLMHASSPDRDETFIERYLSETKPLWHQLANTLWTPRHTSALIKKLWGSTPPLTRTDLSEQSSIGDSHRHPGYHLPDTMSQISDAANAYRAICCWIDNESEACKRGDFTKDRDERLALGAGHTYKQRAWRWIVDNT